MLDIRYVVENLEEVTKRLSTRGTIPPALKQLKDLDSNRRKSIQKAEAIKQKKNEANELIAKKKKSKESVDDILKKMKEFSEEEKALDEDINKLSQQLTDFLLHIPNLPHKSVTIGKSSEENKIVRTWGEKPKFPFKPKDHVFVRCFGSENLNLILQKNQKFISSETRAKYFEVKEDISGAAWIKKEITVDSQNLKIAIKKIK